jgi:hypothetical protein
MAGRQKGQLIALDGKQGIVGRHERANPPPGKGVRSSPILVGLHHQYVRV